MFLTGPLYVYSLYRANPNKLSNVQKKLEGLCVQDHDIKQWAQKVHMHLYIHFLTLVG